AQAPASDGGVCAEELQQSLEIEEGSRRGQADRGRVAAPAPAGRVLAEAGANRVPGDVAQHGEEVSLGLDQLGLVAVAEQPAELLVPVVEGLRVHAVESLHAER